MSNDINEFQERAKKLKEEDLDAFIDELKQSEAAVKNIFTGIRITRSGSVQRSQSTILDQLPWGMREKVVRRLLFEADTRIDVIRRRMGSLYDLSVSKRLSHYEAMDRFASAHTLSMSQLPVQDLEKVRSFKRMRRAKISDCLQVEDISALSDCKSLAKLTIHRAPALKQANMGDWAVEELDLGGLSIESFSDFVLPKKLKRLTLRNCEHLTSFQGLDNLGELQSISINSCPKIQNLKGLPPAQELAVWSCAELETLAGIEGCRGLKKASFHDCSGLKSMKGISELARVSFHGCGLQTLEGLDKNGILEHLSIYSCAALSTLKGIEKSQSLTALELTFCEALTSVSELEGLSELRVVTLYKTSVKRKDVKEPLRSVCTWAGKYDLEKLSQRLPMHLRGNKAKPGSSATLNKLKRLLKSKDVDAIDQGLEIFEAVQQAEWFDALLEDVYFEELKDREVGRVMHRFRSKRFTPFTANYVILALLAKAPKESSIAQALKDKVTKLDLYGRYEDKSMRSVRIQDLAALPKLERLEVQRYEMAGDGAPALPSLSYLNLSGRSPTQSLKWLSNAPKLDELVVASEAVRSLDGVSQVRLTKLQLSYCKLESLKPLQGHPSLEVLKLYNPRLEDGSSTSEPLRIASLKSLEIHSLRLSSFKILEGLDQVENLSLMGITAKSDEFFDPAPLLALPALKKVRVGWNSGVDRKLLQEKGLL